MPPERQLINKIKVSIGPDGNVLNHEKIEIGQGVVGSNDVGIYYDPNKGRVIGFEIPTEVSKVNP